MIVSIPLANRDHACNLLSFILNAKLKIHFWPGLSLESSASPAVPCSLVWVGENFLCVVHSLTMCMLEFSADTDQALTQATVDLVE
jgi:hypothetical protein